MNITHIKPGEMQAAMSEVGKMAGSHRNRALAAGPTMQVGGA